MVEIKKNRLPIVLVAEDSPIDQYFISQIITEEKSNIDIRIVDDGEAVLDYLHHKGEFTEPKSSPRPDLILMDLNMPKLNGKEVLTEIGKDKELAPIPVVIQSASNRKKDINDSIFLGAKAYICKPTDLDEYRSKINYILDSLLNFSSSPQSSK